MSVTVHFPPMMLDNKCILYVSDHRIKIDHILLMGLFHAASNFKKDDFYTLELEDRQLYLEKDHLYIIYEYGNEHKAKCDFSELYSEMVKYKSDSYNIKCLKYDHIQEELVSVTRNDTLRFPIPKYLLESLYKEIHNNIEGTLEIKKDNSKVIFHYHEHHLTVEIHKDDIFHSQLMTKGDILNLHVQEF